MNNPKHQIQITDLLAEAVANAAERRELAAMNELSDGETQDIQGGAFYLINGGNLLNVLNAAIGQNAIGQNGLSNTQVSGF